MRIFAFTAEVDVHAELLASAILLTESAISLARAITASIIAPSLMITGLICLGDPAASHLLLLSAVVYFVVPLGLLLVIANNSRIKI